MNMLILPLMLVVFYFLLIRPQQKRHKEHQALLSKLASGDDWRHNQALVRGINVEGGKIVHPALQDMKV